MIAKETIQFLVDLSLNNSKQWFDANRKSYDAAKRDFLEFIQQVIDTHSRKDKTISSIQAKDCIFRINRDIRFSNDKSPYKTNFGASISMVGRKSMSHAGYYFHLEPGKIFFGGGIYQPDPASLLKVRQRIENKLVEFEKILHQPNFVSIYGGLSSDPSFVTSRVPKGFDKNSPAAHLLKYKSYFATSTMTDEAIMSSDGLKKTLKAFEAVHPLIAWVNEVD